MGISIQDFEKYLSELSINTVDNPYFIEIDLTDKKDFKNLKNILIEEKNKDKYLLIDLSGSTINEIPDSALSGIKTLVGIKLSDKITEIGACAFLGCSRLFNISIPNGVTVINELAFNECTNLVGISLPDSVNLIDHLSFWHCDNLTTITIPKNLTLIYHNAFFNCANLTAINVVSENRVYSSLDGVLYNKDKTVLFRYPEGKIGSSFTIPRTVTKIMENAFYYCKKLYEIIIPEGVFLIENNAFCGCTNLIRINIPNTLTSIGSYAFNYCSSLDIESLEFSEGIKFIKIRE